MPGQQQYRPGAVSAHGPIHHRSRGMFSRYRPCYWAHVHPATLVVFDGREDFLRWGLENREGRGDGVTSNLVDMQDGSVRACLNLDPTGAVRRREKAERRRKKEERRGRKKGGGKDEKDGGGRSGSGSGSSGEEGQRTGRLHRALDVVFLDPHAEGGGGGGGASAGTEAAERAANYRVRYNMTGIKAKLGDAKGRGAPHMNTFKIERIEGGGVASAGEAFGSPDLQELEALRAVVSKTLMRVDGKV